MNTKYVDIINIYNSRKTYLFLCMIYLVIILFNLHHLPCLAPRLRTDSELLRAIPPQSLQCEKALLAT